MRTKKELIEMKCHYLAGLKVAMWLCVFNPKSAEVRSAKAKKKAKDSAK